VTALPRRSSRESSASEAGLPRRSPRQSSASEGWAALAAYSLLTVALTWPLAAGLTRDVPADLVDPVLNAWIVASDAERLGRALTGDGAALLDYWHPKIFAPHPLALAYSEHLTPQAIQILPVYLLSRNPILSYNLLFISTFILSAFGMFLFVRELTGNRLAAFVAGLAFGFAPYRVASLAHLQVLSSAWMPFALYGFRRFFVTGRTRPLAGGAAAWVAQNLSCGYYLLFFSPVVVLYLAWEVGVRRMWRDARTLARLAGATLAVFVATFPFLLPYLELRRQGFGPRSLLEVTRFGADVHGFLTASGLLNLWGSIARAWPAAEGELFPGVTLALLAALAVVDAARRAREEAAAPSRTARVLAWMLAIAIAVSVALLFGWSLRTAGLRVTSLSRALTMAGVIAGALLVVSAGARTTMKRMAASPAGFFAGVTICAAVMALGPEINARGRTIEDAAPYAAFYHYVPGVDGLRVPARFGMIVAFGMAVLGGLGAARLVASHSAGLRLAAAAGLLVIVESAAVPLLMNHNDTNYKQPGLAALPGRVAPDEAGPLYAFLAGLPAASVVLELPAGEPAFDVRYMLLSLKHDRALVNGYSGGAPVDYLLLVEALKDALISPEQAWNSLTSSAATHVVVHEASYEPGRGARISAWLAGRGARQVAMYGEDRVFAIR
jgi:hypothetical protein